MRVFVTGATGFIGSYLAPELRQAGHTVIGLCRSDEGEEKLARSGVQAFRGDLDDLDRLLEGVKSADGVIHAAFNHDFTQARQASETDRKVIAALGVALAGTDRPLIVTSGTGLVERSAPGALVTEADPPASAAKVPRAATEEAAAAVLSRGVRVMVMRLPQTHDTRNQGRIAHHNRLARQKGRVAYIGDGANRLAAVHVSDAVRLFRLALETGKAGACYHAVAEEGVPMREIAEVIGNGLKLPVESIAPEAAADYFGPLAGLAGLDMAASAVLTRSELGWTPIGPGLMEDMRQMDWT